MNITIETEARCPNCGTRYLRETECGDYRCRDLIPRPHAKGQKYLLKGEELVEGFMDFTDEPLYAEKLSEFLETYEKESEIGGKKGCCARCMGYDKSELLCENCPCHLEGKPEDEPEFVCPHCGADWADAEMIGDPEYNDLWLCEKCGKEYGSAVLEGKPEGECEHVCSGNCRRVGCNCGCGEFHDHV